MIRRGIALDDNLPVSNVPVAVSVEDKIPEIDNLGMLINPDLRFSFQAAHERGEMVSIGSTETVTMSAPDPRVFSLRWKRE